MNNLSWLYPIIIGAVAGWLAGLIKSGYGFGLLGNIVIGIIGSYIALDHRLGQARLSLTYINNGIPVARAAFLYQSP